MKNELMRMVSGRGFCVSLLAAAAAVILGTPWTELAADGLLENGAFVDLFYKALSSKIVCYVMPVIAVLPWSDSFLSEWKGGFLKSALPRTGRRAYMENKLLAVALGGFLAWTLAGVLVCSGYFLVFFPMEKRGTVPVNALRESAETLLRCGLIGGIFGSLGGISGVLGGSSYLAFGIPFVVYYFCMILQERYFPDALWLYPPQWITGSADWGANKEGLWLFLLLLLFITSGAHAAVLYARLEEL